MNSLVSLLKKKSRASAPSTQAPEKTGTASAPFFVCPECGNPHVVHHYFEGHYSCTECGAVTAQNVISEEQEWREFEEDPKTKSRSRVSGAIDDDAIGLNSGRGRGKATARIEAELAKANVKKAKLQNSFKAIEEIALKLQLKGTVKKRTMLLYKELSEANAFQGRRQRACIGAVIYQAGLMEKSPVNIDHIIVSTNASKREIKKAFKEISRVLKVKKDADQPVSLVQQACDELHFGQSAATASKYCIEQVYQQGLANERTVSTIAATVLTLVLKSQNEWTAEKESQIATQLNVSKKTISDYLKELNIYKNSILPKP